MRWRHPRDGASMQTCMWCFHVKTGTFLLGIISLVLQVSTLAMITVAALHPDAVPVWISALVAPRSDHDANRSHEKLIDSNDATGMSNVNKNAMMEDSGILMIGPNLDPIVLPSRFRDGKRRVGDEAMRGGKETEMFDEEDIDKVIQRRRSQGANLTNEDKKMVEADGTVKGVVDKRWRFFDADDMRNGMLDKNGDTERNDAQKRLSSEPSDSLFPLEDQPATSDRRPVELDADDKFLLFVTLMGCIGASITMVLGVLKGQPGYLMPYMGIQVFDFCISSLTVFTFFSFAPNVKLWIAAQPDSFPMKSVLIAMDSDRLLLAFILVSVLILVVKAYLMAVVWACYKYMTHYQNEVGRLRRSTEEDMRNPEDSELLLPPKYEDIVDTPDTQHEESESNPPPPYHLG